MEPEIDVAQLAERAVGANPGGADRAFEDAGDLGEGEFLEAREQQHLAVVAIEAGERGLEERVVVARGGEVRSVRRFVRVLVQIGGIGGVRRSVGFAEVIGGAAAREVIHPGSETPIVPVSVAVFEHPLEHRLRDILGGSPVAGVLHQITEERAVVTLEEFTERVEFAVTDGEHERVIGALFGSGVHRGKARLFNHGWTRMNVDFFESGNHGGSGAWLMLPVETVAGRKGYWKFLHVHPL